MVSNPNQFDVLLLPNLYGNILTNIACGLVGGPGITSGRNYGDTHAVFETVNYILIYFNTLLVLITKNFLHTGNSKYWKKGCRQKYCQSDSDVQR